MEMMLAILGVAAFGFFLGWKFGSPKKTGGGGADQDNAPPKMPR